MLRALEKYWAIESGEQNAVADHPVDMVAREAR